MVIPSGLATILDFIRGALAGSVTTVVEPARQSLPDLASAALRPGTKTWLVARAVSLRAF
jgi:hypothetical protein